MGYKGRTIMRNAVGTLIVILLALAVMISMTSCADQRPVVDDLCSSMEPVYLSDPEIRSLSRRSKEIIAGNNRMWESRCAVGMAPVRRPV